MAYSTIDDPTLHFSSTIWTGNGTDDRAIAIDGAGMQPDFIWIKSRNDTDNHRLVDSVRGATRHLEVDNISADQNSGNVKTFTSAGVTLSTNGSVNANNELYVGWAWKGGGSASNNTDGNKTISLSVNTTAGFSVGIYTGDGQDNTIGHGLGAIPDWLMIKNRTSGSRKWQLWHKDLTGNNKYLAIDRDDGELTDTASWNNTAPTSTVWSTYGSGEANQNGENFVCYAWTSIKGFSDFGSYKGTANADGPFIYTGFRPAWIMTKQINGSSSWIMHDNKRDPINPLDEFFTAEVSDAAGDLDSFDLCSNGFKIRTANGDRNSNGDDFVYWAFAESPLVNPEGIPNNAR